MAVTCYIYIVVMVFFNFVVLTISFLVPTRGAVWQWTWRLRIALLLYCLKKQGDYS
jgi:hypothetical protein